MTERQDGFWWVRICADSRWYVGEVHDNELTVDRLDPEQYGDSWLLEAPDEWGPFLGVRPKNKRYKVSQTP